MTLKRKESIITDVRNTQKYKLSENFIFRIFPVCLKNVDICIYISMRNETNAIHTTKATEVSTVAVFINKMSEFLKSAFCKP